LDLEALSYSYLEADAGLRTFANQCERRWDFTLDETSSESIT